MMTRKAWLLIALIFIGLLLMVQMPNSYAAPEATRTPTLRLSSGLAPQMNTNPDKFYTLYLPMIYPRILQLPLTPTPRPTIQATPTATSAVPPTSIMATIPPTQTPQP
jgi:hypothetical protein